MREDGTGGSRAATVAAGASGATAADPAVFSGGALGLEAMGIAEMTRGTVFGASRISIGCCSRGMSFSFEPALVRDVWLESFRPLSLLFRTMLSGSMPALTIGGSEGNTYPPNMAG